jgi:hypothetical protein
MERRGLGEANSIGLSGVCREVQENQTPIVLTKNGDPVVLLLPCNHAMASYLDDAEALGNVLRDLSKKGGLQSVREYLAHQMAIGHFAKTLLVASPDGLVIVNRLEAELAKRLDNLVKQQELSFSKNRPEDMATLESDQSAAAKEGKGRRRKSAATANKQNPPRKRKTP